MKPTLADERHIAVLTSGQGKTTDIINLLLSKAWRGRILDDLEQREEARDIFKSAIDLGRRNLAKNQDSRDLQYTVSRLLHWDCIGQVKAEKLTEETSRQIGEAVVMCESLHKEFSLSEGFQKNLSDALRTAGRIQARSGDNAAAGESFSKGVLLTKTIVEDSKLPGRECLLAEMLRDRSGFVAEMNRTDAAISDLKAGLAAADAAFAEVPEAGDWRC